MKCRAKCGACCIAPSISSSIPGMPAGKRAGVPCIHLTDDFSCAIYNHPEKPEVCHQFKADPIFCSNSREGALQILQSLENIKVMRYA